MLGVAQCRERDVERIEREKRVFTEIIIMRSIRNLVATLLAKFRHIIDLLPLLPSGPGGVYRVQLRNHQ